MTVQRLQTVIIILLLLGCVGIGASLYAHNNEIAGLHDSIGTLSDGVRQTAKIRSASTAAVTEKDIRNARAMLETCGQSPAHAELSVEERLDAILPYLRIGKKFSTIVDDGYELVDACVDDSADPRILFVAVRHLPDFRGDVAYGIINEADPKAATIVTTTDSLNLVNGVSPSTCMIVGNGASPASQFLIRCDNDDMALRHGYVLDFKEREETDAYQCSNAKNGTCKILDEKAFEANREFFDDEVQTTDGE